MLKRSPKHASIFATLRQADLGLSASGLIPAATTIQNSCARRRPPSRRNQARTSYLGLIPGLTWPLIVKEDEKPNDYLVGVAGFEPATPASRTHQPDHHSPHYQRLSTTQHDPRLSKNRVSSAPACRLRAKADQGCRRPSHPVVHEPADRFGEVRS
jgi:hypothetical protein